MKTDLPLKIVTPAGMLGYGYPEAAFWAAVESGIDAIVIDSGSTDPGPYMLGLGQTLVTDDNYLRDLRPILKAGKQCGVPVIISSAGGAGTNAQVDAMVKLVDTVAAEEGFSLSVGVIYADVTAELVVDKLNEGSILPNPHGDLPSVDKVRAATAIVAQMGVEPFLEILRRDDPVDVIVAGRAYDPAPHAALALLCGAAAGVAWHMGKIIECGGACAEPKGGGVIATVERDHFDLVPMSPEAACTPLSVAAHTLYEKSRPDRLPGPGGVLNVEASTFTALDERSVRVAGSLFEPSAHQTVKIEGAGIVGYRTIFIGGVRDPILIDQLDDFLVRVVERVKRGQPALASAEAELIFHVYGRDGVMGATEPRRISGHEVGILGEIVAPTQELANAIATSARIATLHLPYPGQMATAGNFALPLNPMENPIGPVCEFSLYHVMNTGTAQLFEIGYRSAGQRAQYV